jgi:hypothetical protein
VTGRRVVSGKRKPQPGLAPGVVKVRLSGDEDDIDAVAALLGSVTIERSRPYENREDPGIRVYLTLQIPDGGA